MRNGELVVQRGNASCFVQAPIRLCRFHYTGDVSYYRQSDWLLSLIAGVRLFLRQTRFGNRGTPFLFFRPTSSFVSICLSVTRSPLDSRLSIHRAVVFSPIDSNTSLPHRVFHSLLSQKEWN